MTVLLGIAVLAVLGRILYLLEIMFRSTGEETPEPEPQTLSNLERAADVQQSIADTLSRRSEA